MPWNPGIQDRSGELLAAGIGGAGDSLAAGITKYFDRKKKENDNAGYTEKLFKNNPEIQQAAGLDYESFRGLSAKEKIQTGMAAIANLHMKQAASEDAAKRQEQAARSQLLQQEATQAQMRTAEQQQTTQGQQRFSFLAGGGQPVDGEMGPPAPATSDPGAIIRAALGSGMVPKDIESLATGLARMKSLSTDGTNFQFQEDPVTGNRFAVHGGTTLPSGVNPALAQYGKAMGLIDENGNPIGAWAVPNPKGGMQVVKPPSEARDMRDTTASVAQLETVLQGLDKDVHGWENRNASIAKKEKGYEGMTPIPQGQIDELKTRRERVKKHLDALDGPLSSTTPAAGAAAPKAAKGTKMSSPQAEQSRANAAAAIQRNPPARAAILERLKQAGVSIEGL